MAVFDDGGSIGVVAVCEGGGAVHFASHSLSVRSEPSWYSQEDSADQMSVLSHLNGCLKLQLRNISIGLCESVNEHKDISG